MIILKNNLERWLVKLKCWLLFCFFGNCFHLCKVQSLRVRWEIGHHIHVGGFFISIRKVHDSVRYSGVYPRANYCNDIGEPPYVDFEQRDRYTVFFVPISSKVRNYE